jgi:hypothetical protein
MYDERYLRIEPKPKKTKVFPTKKPERATTFERYKDAANMLYRITHRRDRSIPERYTHYYSPEELKIVKLEIAHEEKL